MLAGPLPLRWYACYKYFHYFVLVVAKIKSKKRIKSELINAQKSIITKKIRKGQLDTNLYVTPILLLS